MVWHMKLFSKVSFETLPVMALLVVLVSMPSW